MHRGIHAGYILGLLMTIRTVVRSIGLSCIVVLAACGSPFGPNDVAGTYALRRVAGDSLPTVLYENQYVSVRVFADTLRFTADQRGALVTIREITPLNGDPSTGPQPWETAFS